MNNPYYNQYYMPYYQPVYTNIQQPQQNQTDVSLKYDFVGKYVTSYDDVKSAPFTEQTCIYLDTANDRVYIKELTKDGIPSVNVLGLIDVQDKKISTQEIRDSSIDQLVKDVQTLTKRINDIDNKIIQTNF